MRKFLILIAFLSFPLTNYAFDFKGLANEFGKILDSVSKKSSTVSSSVEDQVEMSKKNFYADGVFTTNNSEYLFDHDLPEGTQWIMVAFEKDQDKFHDIYKVDELQKTFPIYFKRGKGTYKLNVFYSKLREKYWESPFDYLVSATVHNNDPRKLDFLLPSLEVQSTHPEIVQLSKQIVGDEKEDIKKIKLIHDFLLDYLAYDDDGYKTKEYLITPSDAYFVLKRRVSVCDGYSKLFAALLRAQGIRAAVIYGEADLSSHWELHAWNAVYVNGKWEFIDITWNDNLNNRYKYYMSDDTDFLIDHRSGEFQEKF